jgi:RNA polymerase sigma-70 factor (ECF subfamily)
VKPIPQKLAARLHRQSGADTWSVPLEQFTEALQASADRGCAGDLASYLDGLHLKDLALACACVAGEERAWEHFIREYRPALYRAADALDPGGGARELADALYADLYGVGERDGERRSLFRYFHGRSSLATWLRAVLAQRHVDTIRASRRMEPLPDDESAPGVVSRTPPDPERARFLALIQRALTVAISLLTDRDRLRLACYYSQQLTLAETGRLLREHEATVSRQLAKTRQTLRKAIERHLRDEHGLDEAQISQCFASVADDPGPVDLGAILRKDSVPDRSI